MAARWVLSPLVPVLLAGLAPFVTVQPAAAATVGLLQAETMSLPAPAGRAFSDSTASAQAGLLLWSNGAASGSVAASSPAVGLVVRARGDQCGGAPLMQVVVDGRRVARTPVSATGWRSYAFPGTWAAGTHRVVVSFSNDHTAGCDRNLRLDSIALTTAQAPAPVPTPPAPADGNPFEGATPYRDPASRAWTEATARRSWDPAGAAALDKVAQAAGAAWFGDWNPTATLAATVRDRVAAERAAGALPVLVAYDIPHRDCGSHSAGGAPDATAYRQWIGALATGIGAQRAVVVLEPDALAQLDCLSAADQAERTGLLAEAVTTLGALPATTVYLDAGGATWHPAAVMVPRLAAAGVASARGFSLNVSGYNADAVNLPYGEELSRLLGGDKHFVLDSSRNGNGAGDTWCNPAGRALGVRMTAATGHPLADAFTWIKAPGESDGTCGGGPSAGQFWTDYAIGLGARAAW